MKRISTFQTWPTVLYSNRRACAVGSVYQPAKQAGKYVFIPFQWLEIMAHRSDVLSFKLLLVGEPNVGKTSIIRRFSQNVSNTTFICPLGVGCTVVMVEIGGKRIKLEIWEILGKDYFNVSFYHGVMGIMLVYDVTNNRSFETITKWLQLIHKYVKRDVKLVLIGNKCDLEKGRVVSKERGEQAAMGHNMELFETSAILNINISDAFFTLIEDILSEVRDVVNGRFLLPGSLATQAKFMMAFHPYQCFLLFLAGNFVDKIEAHRRAR